MVSKIDNLVCDNDIITFTVVESTYDEYNFYNNASLIGSGSFNDVSTDLLENGNSIYVDVVDSYGCEGSSASAINTSITPNPQITVSIDSTVL